MATADGQTANALGNLTYGMRRRTLTGHTGVVTGLVFPGAVGGHR